MGTPIIFDAADVRALLVGGAWITVRDVRVEFAEYRSGTDLHYATGLHIEATIRTGSNSGDRIVVPVDRVDAVRIA
jgi:hypothetical protein